MNHDTPNPHLPLFSLGRSVGMAAFIWGYPLVESVRTCRAMTVAPTQGGRPATLPFDHLVMKPNPSTAADRLVVAPANDLLYGTAWFNLASGPRLLTVPSSRRHHGRYFSLALYDAWTNNFANPGLRNSNPLGETVALVGPGTPPAAALPDGVKVLRCPTDLVWLIPRVLVGSGDDVLAARAVAADIQLGCPDGTTAGRHPPAVLNWVGPVDNTVVALGQRPGDASDIARHFFTNLCRALVDTAPSSDEAALLAWLQHGQIVPGDGPDWARLPAPLRDGLQQGLVDAVALVVSGARPSDSAIWRVRYDIGRWGTNYLLRAIVAFRGLAALASDEAVYASCDVDAGGQALDGRHDYTLRFAAGDLPPVDAFWSVTLYGEDFFLHPNAHGRFAIGDRTPGLQQDADGGITLLFSHEEHPGNPNWLPAPEGRFSLALRLYHPRPGLPAWPIPPVCRVAA
jgi:hypothetical protein